jgi:hypothetical protein
MGLFNGPRPTKEQHEQSVHLNLISRINTLELNNSELQAKLQVAQGRIAELEHQLKVECDAYLWKRKLMSRRIAFLQGWMKKLFKYGSLPDARRNQMTMTTEIPDTLMREGEDLLLETPALENGDE